jgi:hypothetical protein
MSLISDVREGVRGLDLSRWNLRKFGLLVGGVFLFIAALALLGGRSEGLVSVLGVAGAVLVAVGAFFPGALREVYKVWMGAALAAGWFVSRVLLTVLFFLVVTPIGLTARIVGKRFMEVDIDRGRETYWTRRDRERKVNYEKMY